MTEQTREMMDVAEQQEKSKASLASTANCTSYREPTLLERIESEIEHGILRLSKLQEKRKLLREDPSLADKINLFNRY